MSVCPILFSRYIFPLLYLWKNDPLKIKPFLFVLSYNISNFITPYWKLLQFKDIVLQNLNSYYYDFNASYALMDKSMLVTWYLKSSFYRLIFAIDVLLCFINATIYFDWMIKFFFYHTCSQLNLKESSDHGWNPMMRVSSYFHLYSVIIG